jgi:dolichol-phosphate mannosyltransferase
VRLSYQQSVYVERLPVMSAPPDISVIAPLFNEEHNVLPLVDRVLAALGRHPGGIEVLLVDDASRDATWERIKTAAALDPRVRGIRHLRNRGQSAALFTGFLSSHGNILATLDGDLQNDPADFPEMLRHLAEFDMVCGVRAKRADTWLRRISSRIARLARWIALRSDFLDAGCNMRVFKRRMLPALPPFDGLHRFMPILARNAGAKVMEMPVRHHPRASGMSKYGVWNRLGRGICDLLMVGLYLRRQLGILAPAGDISAEGAVPRATPVADGSRSSNCPS